MIVIESLNHIGITVSDLDNSIRFYKELFDFDIIENISNAGQAFLKMGDIMLNLMRLRVINAVKIPRIVFHFILMKRILRMPLMKLKKTELKLYMDLKISEKGKE